MSGTTQRVPCTNARCERESHDVGSLSHKRCQQMERTSKSATGGGPIGGRRGGYRVQSKSPTMSPELASDTLDGLDEEARMSPEADELRTIVSRAAAKKDPESFADATDAMARSVMAGGGTIRLRDDGGAEMVSEGFCVSPYPDREFARPAAKLTMADYIGYEQKNADLLAKDGHHLGVWRNPEDNMVYLDVSVVVDDAAQARKMCADHNQLAYFDMARCETVQTRTRVNDPQASTGSSS